MPPDTPLLRRIRESVIGDDQVMPGPYGPRRVTYADYTASGRALELPGGLHPRRGAAAATRTRTPSPAAPACRPPGCARTPGAIIRDARRRRRRDRGDLLRLRRDRRDRQAGRHPRPAHPADARRPLPTSTDAHPADAAPGGLHRPVRAPLQRAALARVDRRRRRDPARTPTATSTSTALEAELVALRRPAAEDRLVLGGQQRHRHRQRHAGDLGAAAPARRAVVLGLRRRRAVRRDRHVRRPRRDPLSYKDAIFLSPHKFIGGPCTPGVLVVRRELLPNRVPDVPGGGTVAYVNPTEHRYLDDPVQREEGGTPAIIESIRAGLVFQLKEAVGIDVIRAHEEHYLRRAVAGVAGTSRRSRSSATSTPSGCRSSRSWCGRRSGRYLHHNFVVALLNDLFGIQSRGGCSCAGPVRAPAAGHRPRALARVRAGDRRTAARGSSPAGCGSTSTTSSPRRSSTTSSRRCGSSPVTAGGCCGDYRFDPATRPVAAPRGPVEPPLRLSQVGVRRRRQAEVSTPRSHRAGVRRCRTTWRSSRTPVHLSGAEHRLRGPREHGLRSPEVVRAAVPLSDPRLIQSTR